MPPHVRRYGSASLAFAVVPCRWHVRAYERFFQPDVAPHQRHNDGLEALFREFFPIRGHDGSRSLHYVGYELGPPPLSLEECRDRRCTYASPLSLRLRLAGPEPIEQSVEVAAIPCVVGNGTFLINGSERILLAQLHRAPGIDFFATRDEDTLLHGCRIQPQRGTVVQILVTRRDTLEARIARGVRVSPFTLLRALSGDHSTDADLLRGLTDVRTIPLTTLAPPALLADDVIDAQTGECYHAAGDELTAADQERLADRVGTVTVFASPPDPVLLATLREEQPRTREAALLDLYHRLRPGHPPSLDRARQTFHERFTDPHRYNLGPPGRARLNHRLKLSEKEMTLAAGDLVAALRSLLAVRAGAEPLDDVNDLSHRRVRFLDELLAVELRPALFRFRRIVQERLHKAELRTPRDLARQGAIGAAIEGFFSRHEMSQLVEQTNPLAQWSHERRVSALGPDGVDRQRVRFDVRDVHLSHLGRLCPVETPEGAAIGLVSHLALHADVDEMGFLVAPTDVPQDRQLLGVSAALIPFVQHDDANRALMGANMQRQAVPLLHPEVPIVATGVEALVGRRTSMALRAGQAGQVTYVDAQTIQVNDREHPLSGYVLLPNGLCLHHKPIVTLGETVAAGQVIADGPAMRRGELALGRNVLVAFLSWEGYNFEDAIVLSERLVECDAFTSLHLEEHEIDLRDNRLGTEEVTRDVPGVPPRALIHLGEDGVVRLGSRVLPGDVLVGKVVPRARPETTPQDRLLASLLGRSPDRVAECLTVPPGGEGVVIEVRRLMALEPGVRQRLRITVATKRPVVVGDKLAGRHGNKGVVSRILRVEDMPYLADGTPIEMLLNPLGVPSRMNVGQILETHLGWAAHHLGFQAITPVFDGATEPEIRAALKEAGLPESGKCVLYDGRTGRRFEQPVTVGYLYVLKLHHLVEDKVHARATGPYSLITQQPLGGKSRSGGQRLGEMEVWALQAHGAAQLLREMLTLKSDDVEGRARLYEALISGGQLPEPGRSTSFEVLRQELRGLGLDLRTENPEGTRTFGTRPSVTMNTDQTEGDLEDPLSDPC